MLVSTIVDRVPWRPSIELLPQFDQFLFTTEIKSGKDDKVFTEETPVEELKVGCIDYFTKIYNITDVSNFIILIKTLFLRNKHKLKLMFILVTQAKWKKFLKC